MLAFQKAYEVILWRDWMVQWLVMRFQRAEQKYIARHLSLFNGNNQNEGGGFGSCQGYVYVHMVFRHT